MSTCVIKSEVKFTSLLLCICLGVIIPHSSILLTIPVAFIIYKISFYKRPLCVKGAVTVGDWGIVGFAIPPPQAVPLPLHKGGFISQIFKL